MKVKAITISGMHNVDRKTYSFNDINYLFGKNGAGKSTVLEALQLAILGYIPGTAKQTASIFKHANGPQMKITVEFDNGKFVERSWKTKGRTISTDVDTNTGLEDPAQLAGDLELPVFNFNELINMTANKLKDWFISFLPDASEDIDWKKELTDSLNGFDIMDKDLIDNTLHHISNVDSSSTIDLIQQLNEYFKEEQKFLKEELKRSESTIQSLVYYDDADIQGDDDFLDKQTAIYKDTIQQLTSEKEDFIKANQIIESNKRIKTQLNSISLPDVDASVLQPKVVSLTNELNELKLKYGSYDSQIQQIMAEGSQYVAEIKSRNSVISGQGICPYTKSQCDSIVNMIDKMKEEIQDFQSKQNDAQNRLNSLQSEKNECYQSILMKEKELNDLNNQLLSIKSTEDKVNQLKNLLSPDPDMSKFRDLSFYSSEIERLNDLISKIAANKRYNQLIDKLTSEKYKNENSIEVYKSWVKLTDPNSLQTRVMDKPFNDFAEEMNIYLSKMFSESVICKFNLEQKANSFSFGVSRDGKYIPYDLLSSGEKTMYTLAMMLCIVNKSSSELKVLIVDDMLDHLDDRRAEDVFNAIKNVSDVQIIAAGVKDAGNNDFVIKID